MLRIEIVILDYFSTFDLDEELQVVMGWMTKMLKYIPRFRAEVSANSAGDSGLVGIEDAKT